MTRIILSLWVISILLGNNLSCNGDNSYGDQYKANTPNAPSSEIEDIFAVPTTPSVIPPPSYIPNFLEEFPCIESDQPLIEVYRQSPKKDDFKRQRTTILRAASNIIQSKNIQEMIKRIQHFSRKIPHEYFGLKPIKVLPQKLEKDLKKIIVEGKSVLLTARQLENGKTNTKKQLTVFKNNVKNFEKNVNKFASAANSEWKKQHNKSLKIIEDNANNVNILNDARRFINMMNLLSDTIKLLQSIPGRIQCLIFGYCDSNDSNDTDQNINEMEEEGEDLVEDDDDDGGEEDD